MSKRVVIIGGGVIALSVAHYCSRNGHRVIVLERGHPDDEGCSFANAGMIVPSHIVPLASPGTIPLGFRWMFDRESPLYVKPRLRRDLLDWGWKFYRAATRANVDRAAPLLRDLHLASRACYKEWASLWGNPFDLAEHGLFMLCHTEQGLEEEARAADYARKLGISGEVLTPAATAKLQPNLRMTIAGAVYYPIDAHLTPGRLMAALRRNVQQAGAEIRYGAEVTGWRSSGNGIDAVCAGEAEFAGDEFVVCAGVWSMPIVARLRLRLPLLAGKGYSLTVEDPVSLPKIGVLLSEARVAMTPMGSALRFGGTMEMTGNDDQSVNPARLRGIVKSVGRYLPDFTPAHFDHATVRFGLRPCSPDGLPYIGRFSRFDNLCAATGHATMGVSLGPITGRLIGEIVSGEPLSCRIDGLEPDRYASP